MNRSAVESAWQGASPLVGMPLGKLVAIPPSRFEINRMRGVHHHGLHANEREYPDNPQIRRDANSEPVLTSAQYRSAVT